MYGWKARVGLLLPMDNAVMEPELYSVQGLNGISFYAARLNTNKREDMPQNGIELSSVFNELGADAIVYACAETAFLKGVDGNEYISRRIEELTGLPAVTAMSSMVEAVRFLNINTISLVTPYTSGRTEIMMDFFDRMGIKVNGVENKDFSEQSDDPREWFECNLQPPYKAYQMAKKANRSGSEAIVISATNFRTLEIIRELEEDVSKPVITTNQAILWSVFRKLNLNMHLPHLGRLHSKESM